MLGFALSTVRAGVGRVWGLVAAPWPLEPGRIEGEPIEGATLAAIPGRWAGGGVTLAHAWRWDHEAQPFAADASVTLPAGSAGRVVHLHETATEHDPATGAPGRSRTVPVGFRVVAPRLAAPAAMAAPSVTAPDARTLLVARAPAPDPGGAPIERYDLEERAGEGGPELQGPELQGPELQGPELQGPELQGPVRRVLGIGLLLRREGLEPETTREFRTRAVNAAAPDPPNWSPWAGATTPALARDASAALVFEGAAPAPAVSVLAIAFDAPPPPTADRSAALTLTTVHAAPAVHHATLAFEEPAP